MVKLAIIHTNDLPICKRLKICIEVNGALQVITQCGATDSTKINLRGITYVCTERMFDSRTFVYNKIFLKTFIEVGSIHLYASFGQLFEAQ